MSLTVLIPQSKYSVPYYLNAQHTAVYASITSHLRASSGWPSKTMSTLELLYSITLSGGSRTRAYLKIGAPFTTYYPRFLMPINPGA